jgi:HPt (histidine-containing phosphotransfer) domain-containing protein
MQSTLPPHEFDQRALAELREDLGDSFAEFAVHFIATAHTALDQIDAALHRGDLAEAGTQAHSLRGTAGYLGAIAMCDALDALQHGAQHDVARADLVRNAAKARDAFMAVKPRWLPS